MSWQELEPVLRERLVGRIESQPEVLLEHAGGPEGLKADIILATLYGFDEQVDAEWRLNRAEPVLLMPLSQRISASMCAFDPSEPPSIRTARYDLQSNWATMELDWLAYRESLPTDVKPAPSTYMIKVALVRYRRSV